MRWRNKESVPRAQRRGDADGRMGRSKRSNTNDRVGDFFFLYAFVSCHRCDGVHAFDYGALLVGLCMMVTGFDSGKDWANKKLVTSAYPVYLGSTFLIQHQQGLLT